jgi:hypothetical protein
MIDKVENKDFSNTGRMYLKTFSVSSLRYVWLAIHNIVQLYMASIYRTVNGVQHVVEFCLGDI